VVARTYRILNQTNDKIEAILGVRLDVLLCDLKHGSVFECVHWKTCCFSGGTRKALNVCRQISVILSIRISRMALCSILIEPGAIMIIPRLLKA
jgi:hypothetical protein